MMELKAIRLTGMQEYKVSDAKKSVIHDGMFISLIYKGYFFLNK